MEFKPGDRIYCEADEWGTKIDRTGTIVDLSPLILIPNKTPGRLVSVAFDNWQGHDCEGTTPEMNGRYVFESDLVLESVYKSKLYKLLNEET